MVPEMMVWIWSIAVMLDPDLSSTFSMQFKELCWHRAALCVLSLRQQQLKFCMLFLQRKISEVLWPCLSMTAGESAVWE